MFHCRQLIVQDNALTLAFLLTDMRLAIGLRPAEAGRNSLSFAYRNIRDLMRKQEEDRKRLKTDSGISVFDSKEIINLE